MQYAYEVDHLLTCGFYTYFTSQADNEKTNLHIGNVLNIASNALQHATICFGNVPCPRSYFACAALNLHVLIIIITMITWQWLWWWWRRWLFVLLWVQNHWVDETGVPATRRQMMVALQNVQQLLVMLGRQSELVREARSLHACGLTDDVMIWWWWHSDLAVS